MHELSRRDFLHLNFQEAQSLCDEPAYANNEACQDPDLRSQLDSGNPHAKEWLIQSSAAGDTAKCSSVFLVGGGLLGGLKWLAERRKRLALKPENIDFSHTEQ